MVFSIYFAGTIIFIMGLAVKLNHSFTSYIEKNYGTWENMSLLLQKTYKINYVPLELHTLNFGWFLFSKYDFGDENIKNFKLAFKLNATFLFLFFPSFVFTFFIFLSTPSIYNTFSK